MSPKIGTNSSGKRSVSSISAAIGATCRSTIRLMLSTNAVCSSVRYMNVSLYCRSIIGLGAPLLAQHARRVDVFAQHAQFLGRWHRGDWRCSRNHEFESGLLLNLLDRHARMQRQDAHSPGHRFEVEHAERTQHQLRSSLRQATVGARCAAFEKAGTVKKIHTLRKAATIVSRHHDVEASRQRGEGADADGAGAAQSRLVMRADADRIDVAELVDLNGAENCKIEEMDLPVDEIDHLWKIHHRLAPRNIFGASGRPDHRLVAIDHAAGPRHPP